MKLTPYQFEALKDWIEALAYAAAGEAVHQRRSKGIVENAEERAYNALVDNPADDE